MTNVGIDLGTSNSLISFWDINKREAVLIKNSKGKTLTPSAISIDNENNILIGQDAYDRIIEYPEQTVQHFKRFMGTDKRWEINKKYYTPIDFSALLLKQLKTDAELYLNEEITDAIISVPAYFNNDQREATIKAGKLAGFLKVDLISEPTAAAIAYGINREEDSHFLICDLGGGTYDISLLEYFEGTLNVQAISGDNHLGGVDFTNAMVDDFLNTEGYLLKIDHLEKIQLKQIMNQAKENFDEKEGVKIEISIANQEFTYQRTEEQLNEIFSELYNRLKTPILRVLTDAKIEISDLNQIILVGGTTKFRLISYQFGKLFERPPYVGVNPDESIAVGAGIRSGMDTDIDLVDEMILTDVSPFSMGIEMVSDENSDELIFSPIIERNTPLPASRVQIYEPVSKLSRSVEIKIYQGESMLVNDNLLIGKFEMPVAMKERAFEVRFTYDKNGVLEVKAINGKKKEKTLLINSGNTELSDAQMRLQMEKLESLKVNPKDKPENRKIIDRINRLFEDSIGEDRARLEEVYMYFVGVLSNQNSSEIKHARAEVTKILDDFEA
ncbi:Hsp70 family protein [Lactobacillus sp. YT155]|uniref:Hsp70 family protein n=1 Tax=Lactobacillus sp. YT155 TaxID=3060955 RepID=UPI00266024AE|nr:Hsp70 family protein [Lactobacillus sp. YT155]MDO1605035.1 Hsp70 family protein [Lactobacillus sp. YT155]